MTSALLSPMAHASALYFEKVQVKTASEVTCLHFANDTARALGFTNMHSSAQEVAGETQGVYVSTTCIGRGAQPAIAVVMATSSDFASAKQVGQSAANRIRGITCIDSPC